MAGFTQPFEFGFEYFLIGTGKQGVDRFMLSDERFFELAAAGGKNSFDRPEVFEQIELGAGADREAAGGVAARAASAGGDAARTRSPPGRCQSSVLRRPKLPPSRRRQRLATTMRGSTS